MVSSGRNLDSFSLQKPFVPPGFTFPMRRACLPSDPVSTSCTPTQVWPTESTLHGPAGPTRAGCLPCWGRGCIPGPRTVPGTWRAGEKQGCECEGMHAARLFPWRWGRRPGDSGELLLPEGGADSSEGEEAVAEQGGQV